MKGNPAWAVTPKPGFGLIIVVDLEAISRGYAVPCRDFTATLHSVFSEAVNLQLKKGDYLLTLLTCEGADLPQGIRLGTTPNFSFDKTLRVGNRLVCQSGILGDEHGFLSIDLRRARRWKCKLPNLEAYGVNPLVVSAWISVHQALTEQQRRVHTQTGVAELFQIDASGGVAASEKTGAYIRELIGAARSLDLSIWTSIPGLIGHGVGLTPAGDDFLVGFLTGLHCAAGQKSDRLTFLAALGEKVTSLSDRTNDISRTYLFYATRGQVSSRLAILAEAITNGDDSVRLLQAAEHAMHVGHTSGMETVSGLLIGLSVWGDGLPQV